MNTLTQIQDAYIKAVTAAPLRTRAMVRGKAAKRAFRALTAWGFAREQAWQVIDDARDVADLELATREAAALAAWRDSVRRQAAMDLHGEAAR